MKETANQELLRLRKLNDFRDIILAIIGHDLKAPMNNIKSIIPLLRDNEMLHEEKENLMAELLSAVDSSSQMLDNILDWASQKYLGNMLGKRANDHLMYLSNLVDSAIAFVKHQADSKGINVRNTISEEIKFFGDKQQILFILRNIIGNAIKFSYLDGIVEVAAQPDGNGYIIVSVADSGIGISNDKIPMLFSIEKRYSREGTAKEKGAGLALILCKDFIDNNGGSISICTNGSSGIVVTFTVRSA